MNKLSKEIAFYIFKHIIDSVALWLLVNITVIGIIMTNAQIISQGFLICINISSSAFSHSLAFQNIFSIYIQILSDVLDKLHIQYISPDVTFSFSHSPTTTAMVFRPFFLIVHLSSYGSFFLFASSLLVQSITLWKYNAVY